jgi:hypothetical protein
LLFADALNAVEDGGGRLFGSSAGDVAIFDGGNFDVEMIGRGC